MKKILLILLTSANFLHAESIPLSEGSKNLKKGLYKHYKGAMYEVIGIAHHSETLEEVVIYRLLYGDYGYWVRPADMFMESVEYENQIIPRFQFVGEPGNLIEEAAI